MASPQRRNPRSGVEDLWRRADKTPSRRNGRGKRWRARYVDADGHEFTRAFHRKLDAQVWLDGQVTAIGTGNHVAPNAGKVTVGALYQQIVGQWGHLSENTRAARKSAWDARVRDRWSAKLISDVTTTGARAWVTEMADAGVKPTSIEPALGLLRLICAMAVDDKRIASNPLATVKAPTRTHVARAYLDHVRTDALSSEFETLNDQTLTLFLAYTGLRFGEASAARVKAFDMLRQHVHVLEGAAEVRGKLVVRTPKDWEKRTVPFPAFLTESLAELMVGKGREDLVFTAPRGGPLRLNTWRNRNWARALDAATEKARKQREVERRSAGSAAVVTEEFPQITPHDLRHTAASLAVSAGANVLVVQRMLGHESAADTLDTYSDLFSHDLAAVSGALDAARSAALGLPKTG